MRFTAVLMIWGLALVHLGIADVIHKDTVQGIEFQHVDTKAYMGADNPGSIGFMEFDKFVPGNILYTNGESLKSLDPKRWRPHLIAGRDRAQEYQEGTGSNARFNFMTSFYQHNSTMVVLADSGNDCVRTVSRISNSTATLSGRCDPNSITGSVDGSFASARFFGPYYFAKLPTSPAGGNEQVAFTDFSSIRMMDITTETVSTILPESDSLEQPRVLILSPDNFSLFFSYKDGLGKLGLEFYQVSILSQGFQHGRPVDGPLSSAIFGGDINAMIFLNKNVILVSDNNNNIIRVVDLEEKKVTSICQPSLTSDSSNCDWGKVGPGDITQCGMCYPQSLFAIPEENRILLGSIGNLGYIKTTGLCQEKPKDNEETTRVNPSADQLVFCKNDDHNLDLVIGLSVGGGVLFITLLVFGVVCGLRHKQTLDKYYRQYCFCYKGTLSDNAQFRYTQTK